MGDVSDRILLVSNRLPVQVKVEKKAVSLVPSAGGLAVGLRRPHAETGGRWIGWPGDVSRLDPAQRQSLDRELEEARLVPIHLSPAEIDRYYEGFANGVLWPLFHYMPDRMPLESRTWQAYVDVNARFADVVAEQWRPGDLVWVHDYHLLLLPGMIRERCPTARIGLFLHIPFPSSDVFRILPWRQPVLEGMLGADLLGFHTWPDLQNFSSSVLRVCGLEPEVDHVVHGGRRVRIGAFPMGIDTETWEKSPGDVKMDVEITSSRRSRGSVLLLGVDRLDYTKGIPRRLLAFERLLEKYPQWRRKARFVQVAVPSRDGVAAYQEYRDQVEQLVGRINGRWGSVDHTPVQLLHRSFDTDALVSLYRAADVLLVTSLRDGMNLVAKEFVASRTDDDGVLVLSEFAGAASSMGEALIVNPHDVDGMAAACHGALTMPKEERQRRMRVLREHVRVHTVGAWVSSFVQQLAQVAESTAPKVVYGAEGLSPALTEILGAPALTLLLDHDGTLVPFASTPERAVPDADLLALLDAVARLPGVAVHVVSGRDRDTLSRWYGALPVALHAEHGGAWRTDTGEWLDLGLALGTWREPILGIMESFAAATPGSFVEDKGTSIAWHYRQSDLGLGTAQAREMRYHLRLALANAPVEVLAGSKVVEVRAVGVSKGRAVELAVAAHPNARVLAIGDDVTDEDMFAALPEGALGVVVGERMTRAGWRLPDTEDVRRLLGSVLEARRPLSVAS